MNIETINKKVWLTQEEAETYTGLGRKSLQNLRTNGTAKGTLPFRRVGGSIRYSRKEIDEYFNKHKVTVHG